MKYINDTISCLYDSKRPFSGNLSIGLIIPPFQKNHFYCHAVITATNHRQPCDAGLGFSGCKTTLRRSDGFTVRRQWPNTMPTAGRNPGISTKSSTKALGERAV